MALGQMVREFGTRGLAKILESGGLDYVMLDMEHGGFSIERVSDLAAYFKATPVSPFVRIPAEWIDSISGLLDQGIMGIQIANLETPEQAREVVSKAKFKPVGDRGFSLGGAHTDFAEFKPEAFIPWANTNTMVIAALESPLGVENVDAIAAIEGIDIISIGHQDLTNRMGIHMQLDHPRFREVLRKVIAACEKYGKLARIYPQTDAQIDEYYKMGFKVMMLSKTDFGLYRDALKSMVGHFRAQVK